MYNEIPAIIDGKSKVLGPYFFNQRLGRFVFHDGTEYTLAEALSLSRGEASDLTSVHMVKNVFDGEVLSFERLPRGRRKG